MTHWGPPPIRRWAYLGGAVVAALLAVGAESGIGGLGAGLALGVLAGVALVLGVLDLWFARALSLTGEGVVVHRGPRRSRHLRWSQIERIDATADARGPLRLASLEIDLGDRNGEDPEDAEGSLILLSRHRLGADPAVVAEELRSAWRNGSPR